MINCKSSNIFPRNTNFILERERELERERKSEKKVGELTSINNGGNCPEEQGDTNLELSGEGEDGGKGGITSLLTFYTEV